MTQKQFLTRLCYAVPVFLILIVGWAGYNFYAIVHEPHDTVRHGVFGRQILVDFGGLGLIMFAYVAYLAVLVTLHLRSNWGQPAVGEASTVNKERFDRAKATLPLEMHAERLEIVFRSNLQSQFWHRRGRLTVDEQFASTLTEPEIAFVLAYVLAGRRVARKQALKGFLPYLALLALGVFMSYFGSLGTLALLAGMVLMFGTFAYAMWAGTDGAVQETARTAVAATSHEAGVGFLEKYRAAIVGRPMDRWFADRMLRVV